MQRHGWADVPKWPHEHGDIYDHHFVEYTYGDGTKMYSQCRHIPKCFNKVAEFVQGRKGTLALDNRTAVIEAGDASWKFRGKRVNPYQVEHDRLFDAVRNDKPHNEADYGALSTMTAIMGRMATYSGKVVKWDEALASTIELTPDRYAWDGTPPSRSGRQRLLPLRHARRDQSAITNS